MAIDVTVLRVFTDENGRYGNLLGVVDAASVEPADRQRLATELGYSETIFVTLPAAGTHTTQAHIHTPATELPFAGHPTVGAAWWLNQRTPSSTSARTRRTMATTPCSDTPCRTLRGSLDSRDADVKKPSAARSHADMKLLSSPRHRSGASED